MRLSAAILPAITSGGVSVPDPALLTLPEKVLQFGTGILLRGLPDYFVDQANRIGQFNGRIIVVKSTSQGNTQAFDEQDGLFTLCVRGIRGGEKFEENIINAAVSRVLTASTDWEKILECARLPSLQVIVSNTTEVGIKLLDEDISGGPPISFPGKLLAFLLERYRAFDGSDNSGFVIIPTELIPDNGKKLAAIIHELALRNGLPAGFIRWLTRCNHFCNSLVDRIVTGMPDSPTRSQIEKVLGYRDDLLTMCEVYRLWAIEGDAAVERVVSFAGAGSGMIIAPNIDRYRELKLRLLNGPHILSCGIALLAGIPTVKEAMEDASMELYIRSLMQNQIGPYIPYPIEKDAISAFISDVLDRFRNPHILHFWKNITLNYTQKLKTRCVPVLLNYYEKNDRAPDLLVLGFAAYFAFMKPVSRNGNDFSGELHGASYLIQDEVADIFYGLWQRAAAEEIIHEVLQNTSFWGTDLSVLRGFEAAVYIQYNNISTNGMKPTLDSVLSNKISH